jgi:hypothetical protein
LTRVQAAKTKKSASGADGRQCSFRQTLSGTDHRAGTNQPRSGDGREAYLAGQVSLGVMELLEKNSLLDQIKSKSPNGVPDLIITHANRNISPREYGLTRSGIFTRVQEQSRL